MIFHVLLAQYQLLFPMVIVTCSSTAIFDNLPESPNVVVQNQGRPNVNLPVNLLAADRPQVPLAPGTPHVGTIVEAEQAPVMRVERVRRPVDHFQPYHLRARWQKPPKSATALITILSQNQ